MVQFPVKRITHEEQENEQIYTLGYVIGKCDDSSINEALAENHDEISGYLNSEGKIQDIFKAEIEAFLQIDITKYMYQIMKCCNDDKTIEYDVFILTTKTNACGPLTHDDILRMVEQYGGAVTVGATRLSDETVHLLKSSDTMKCSMFLDGAGGEHYYITEDRFDMAQHYFVAQLVLHFNNRTVFQTQLPAVERMPSQVWQYINECYNVTSLDASTNLCVMSPNDPTADEIEQTNKIISSHTTRSKLNALLSQ